MFRNFTIAVSLILHSAPIADEENGEYCARLLRSIRPLWWESFAFMHRWARNNSVEPFTGSSDSDYR